MSVTDKSELCSILHAFSIRYEFKYSTGLFFVIFLKNAQKYFGDMSQRAAMSERVICSEKDVRIKARTFLSFTMFLLLCPVNDTLSVISQFSVISAP